MKGTLTIIPTPIDEETPLETVAFNNLLEAATTNIERSIFVIEDLKPGRRRWLKWKLPREVVEDFVLYNEHSKIEVSQKLIGELKAGKNVYIMSDGGLPAFCDPGIELVSLCHDNGIKVTSTPFSNSIALAVSLSGFNHNKFVFEGFLPQKTEDRTSELERILTENRTVILMDTPYRLKKLLGELELAMKKSNIHKRIFVAMDLNSANEELVRGSVAQVAKKISDYKREFILLLEGTERINDNRRSKKRSH